MAQTIRLAATTTVGESAALKQRLLPLLESADEVVLDVSDVQHVDTSALQLLFAFCRDRHSRGLSTIWQGDSSAFRNASTALQLDVYAPTASTPL